MDSKIAILRAWPTGYDLGGARVSAVVKGVLTELGLVAEEIDISAELPFFRGTRDEAAGAVFDKIKEAIGTVFITAAPSIPPGAVAARFLEHLALRGNSAALDGKNCMVIAVGERPREAMEVVCAALAGAGAFDSSRLAIPAMDVAVETPEFREILERVTEDFYRVARQGRRFFSDKPSKPDFAAFTGELTDVKPKKPAVPASEIYKKLNIDVNDTSQDDEVREIARFFAKRRQEEDAPQKENTAKEYNTRDFNANDSFERVYAEPFADRGEPVVPKGKSCRQLTRSLPAVYLPQRAQGLVAAIAVSVSGSESFDGCVDIRNTECTYTDGMPANPDLTILADAAVWSDVLKGKFTAQKAFMIGKLKVRGNFALLARFDQLFDTARS